MSEEQYPFIACFKTNFIHTKRNTIYTERKKPTTSQSDLLLEFTNLTLYILFTVWYYQPFHVLLDAKEILPPRKKLSASDDLVAQESHGYSPETGSSSDRHQPSLIFKTITNGCATTYTTGINLATN